MTSPQRAAALALVAAALSRERYQKVTDIMNRDEVLRNAGFIESQIDSKGDFETQP